MTTIDRSGELTDQEFERQLEQLLLAADESGVRVEGGWDVETTGESLDLSVEITRVDR